ncbi:MAG: phage minor capsid protein [Lachnospiraceae bacterium]
MNREYKEKLSRKIENHFFDLEMRIMEDIVRRIKQYGKITSTADWQINRLVALGNSSEDIEKMLKEALDASYPEMFELYDQVIDWEYVRNKDIYEQINARFIPYEENEQLQQLTDALRRQTQEELENITRSLGFYLDYGNGKRVLTPLAQVYQGYLDNAIMDIAFGAFDYNSTLRRVVTQFTNSGLRVIDYASGRSYRANVAARTAVMTGISQLTGHISDMNAEKLGTEYFEVAWHAGARPSHAEWQGKVWTKQQLYDVCGLGTVTGLLGANCYHEYYPFFPGISERNWTDEWLEEQNRKENTPKEWNGKEYTTYEAKQKQRQMETAMRAQREKVELLKKGEADSDEVMLAKCKYQAQLDEYARFSKKMGLKQERERIYLDMKGRIAPSNPKYSNFIKSVEKRESSVTIKKVKDKGTIEVHTIGKIDKNIYRCITEDIVTDEVIITDERIQHIKERHPNDYERYYRYLKKIVEDPDYIVKTNKPNTALILKEIVESEEKQFKTVLRLTTSKDNPEYKNSIITFMKINEKEWSRLIRNKQILYKKE